MTTPRERIIHAIEQLTGKWRQLADQQMAWSKESDAKGDGANSHTERARARIYRECADDLESLRVGIARGPEDQDQSRSDQSGNIERLTHASASETASGLGQCKECGCTTGGGVYCYQHTPYIVAPLKDGTFRTNRNGVRRVWFDAPPTSESEATDGNLAADMAGHRAASEL